jgi:pimeloyl-ACP methyl ester carboxylesterase
MTPTKPVIVIVPGGFCSPDIYQDVANVLLEEGFTVKVIRLTTTRSLLSDDPANVEYKTLASKGMLDDVKEIHDSIAKELDGGSEVVIFGHSYGSLPGLLAIEGHTLGERKTKGLAGGIKAYAAVAGFAFAVRERNIYGTTEQGPVMPNHSHEEGGLVHLHDTFRSSFFSDLPASEHDKAWEKVLGSQSRKSFDHLADFINADVKISMTYVKCEKDEVLPPEYQEKFIQAGGFHQVESLPSGHFPFLSMPQETAGLFKQIAMA